MPNPFAPLLGFLGAVAVGGGSKKRRRKKKQSNAGTNGTSTQRTSSRALDIIRIQRGLPRDQDPSPETDGEVAEDTPAQPNGQPRVRATVGQRPDGAPTLRISKMIGTDTIGITTDGQRGYVGPQWWSRAGREMLKQTRRRYPDATPEEALKLLLKQAVPSVDWESEDLPRGALMLSRRLRRLVEAGYMGREVDVSTPAVSPKVAGTPAEAAGGSVRAPGPMGMPFATPPADLAGVLADAPEDGEEAEEADEAEDEASTDGLAQDGAQELQRGRTRRGGRRGGKKDRKAVAQAAIAATAGESAHGAENPEENAHDTPEGDGGVATGDSDAAGSEADSPAGE